MLVKDLKPDESHKFYKRYINKLPEQLQLVDGFIDALQNTLEFFKGIPVSKLEYKYAHGKWTIKEVLQHLIDAERIFFYRAFRIARLDKTPMAGFDENNYIEPSQANNKSIETLLEEYSLGRQNSIILIKGLSDEHLKSMGNANNSMISARATLFTILGHEQWHLDIIKERYLN